MLFRSSDPHVHWIAPILAGVPFGMGMLLVFTRSVPRLLRCSVATLSRLLTFRFLFSNSIIGYLIDCYLMYAASALAANAIMRSILGAVFPLFSTYMYKNLGNAWASTLVGFLALACVPMPFVFYYYVSLDIFP